MLHGHYQMHGRSEYIGEDKIEEKCENGVLRGAQCFLRTNEYYRRRKVHLVGGGKFQDVSAVIGFKESVKLT